MPKYLLYSKCFSLLHHHDTTESMNFFSIANLHCPPSILNPRQTPPRELTGTRALPFFRALKRGDTKTCHEDNLLGPQLVGIAVFTISLLKFQETLSTRKRGRNSLLSTVTITHGQWSRHESSFSDLLLTLEVRGCSGAFSPSSPFPMRVDSPIPQCNPLSPPPHSCLQPAASLAVFGGALRRGRVKSQKQSTHSALLLLLPGGCKTQDLCCFHLTSTKLEDLQINKAHVTDRFLRLFRYLIEKHKKGDRNEHMKNPRC